MKIPRFYEPQPFSTGQAIDLSDEVVQHVCRVLRMKPGDPLCLFNDQGQECQARLTEVAKRSATVQVEQLNHPQVESPLDIRIGQVLSRGERMDYAVQKSTELGATRISPLFSERCEVKLADQRQEKRTRHWQQVAISACEQSGRTQPPQIDTPQPLAEWLATQDAELKLVLHHHSKRPLAEMAAPGSVALLIGPEGGLTEAEVNLAMAHGFQPLALGPRVMRTETAPVAALAILNHLWGDMS